MCNNLRDIYRFPYTIDSIVVRAIMKLYVCDRELFSNARRWKKDGRKFILKKINNKKIKNKRIDPFSDQLQILWSAHYLSWRVKISKIMPC